MKGKRSTTKGTAVRTVKSRRCPKCKRITLHKDGFTPSGKQRWQCSPKRGGKKDFCYTTTNPEAPYRRQDGTPKEPDQNPRFARALSGIKRFVVTSAQNATPIHDDFFGALRTYCDFNDAELVVIPLRYKNPTSRWTQSQENAEVWDTAVTPYLYNQRKKLNDNLTLVADIKTIPTATKPLSGFESLTGSSSGIFGHTKVQMACVPTPQGRYPKILTTTGAVTIKNFTDSKAGKKGEFHFTLGAVVVEIIGKKFFLRHVNYDTKYGSFIDLDREYSINGVADAPQPLAIVLGDTHRASMDKTVEKVTFGKGGIVETLNPKHLVFHDLHDGAATNHHTRKDPFAQVAKRVADLHIVEKEIEDDVKWLKKVVGKRKGVIVPSNHDDFLARWLREQDWRLDPENAEFYLKTALELVREIKGGNEVPHPFAYWVDRLKDKAPITCLSRDESFTLGGIELAMHGDQGPNGSRGSVQNLRRIGVKTMVGHSHSPAIEEGCWQVGTSTPLRLDYNSGPSSWLNCHGLIHANGKRQLLMIIDGHWCFDASAAK